MKKIVIALDYNPSAQKVAEMGYAVAKALNASITLVHVITDPAFYAINYSPIMGYTGSYTTGTKELIIDIKKEAEKYLTASKEHLGDKKINTKVLDGDREDAILEYAKEWRADLIVIGSHSHKGLERIFVPDLAAHIVKHSTIPLLTIPTNE